MEISGTESTGKMIGSFVGCCGILDYDWSGAQLFPVRAAPAVVSICDAVSVVSAGSVATATPRQFLHLLHGRPRPENVKRYDVLYDTELASLETFCSGAQDRERTMLPRSIRHAPLDPFEIVFWLANCQGLALHEQYGEVTGGIIADLPRPCVNSKSLTLERCIFFCQLFPPYIIMITIIIIIIIVHDEKRSLGKIFLPCI